VRSVVTLTDRVLETPSTVTLRFPYPATADPGQFVMVWIPGDDELPMSLSYTDGPSKGVTIKAMGGTSRRVQSLRAGDPVGIRGPYGNRFDLSPQRILIVSGGSGAAVLARAATPRSVPVFCLMERHMKCALGMCDACALGPYHVCVDGPVFPADRLEKVPDFGAFHRNSSGRRVPF